MPRSRPPKPWERWRATCAPLGVEAVDPVEAAEGVGDADGEEVEAARICGVGEVALEGELFHDGVADELLVEEDLGAEAGAADVQEDALAAVGGGDIDGAVPPGDAVKGAVLRDGVVCGGEGRVGGGGEVVLLRSVRAGTVAIRPGGAPEVLLDGGGEEHFDGRVRSEGLPAAGGDVHGERRAGGEEDALRRHGDGVGEVEVVRLPGGGGVQLEAPAVVGDESAVFRVGQGLGLCVGGKTEGGGGGGKRGGFEQGAAGKSGGHGGKFSVKRPSLKRMGVFVRG